MLEQAAREGDRFAGGDKLRRALSAAMAAGGHGARDGGKTRGALLRRAAQIAHRDLNDVEQAFAWLADALVSHVDSSTLDALEALGLEIADPRRAEGAITHALNEVFDGPLVRQLLGRRAKIRRDQIVDHTGAAQDLKKLHDLSPQDGAVMEELAGLLTDLADFKTLVQVYEDQILRGKDVNVRAELARKVARIWEEQLHDAREAADAWRRVLRMKQGDTEATAGLERAKTNALKKADPGSLREAYAPPKMEAKIEPPPPVKPASNFAPAAAVAAANARTASIPPGALSLPSAATSAHSNGSAAPPPAQPQRSRGPSSPALTASGSGASAAASPSSPPAERKPPQRPLAPRVPSEPPPPMTHARSEPPPLPMEARMPSAPPTTQAVITEGFPQLGADHEDRTRPAVIVRPVAPAPAHAESSPADDEPNTAMTAAGNVAALEMEIDASLGRLELGEATTAPSASGGKAPKTVSYDNGRREHADTTLNDRGALFGNADDDPGTLSTGIASGPHTLPGMPVDAATFNIPHAEPSREEVELDEVDLIETGADLDATHARQLTPKEEDSLSEDVALDDEEHTETSQTVRPHRSN